MKAFEGNDTDSFTFPVDQSIGNLESWRVIWATRADIWLYSVGITMYKLPMTGRQIFLVANMPRTSEAESDHSEDLWQKER